MKLLCVDDDPLILEYMRVIFSEHELITYSSTSGCPVQSCDLLITDLVLFGDESGTDLVRRFKRESPEINAIIYTALTSGPHYREALSVARVIEKKKDLYNLVAAVELYGK